MKQAQTNKHHVNSSCKAEEGTAGGTTSFNCSRVQPLPLLPIIYDYSFTLSSITPTLHAAAPLSLEFVRVLQDDYMASQLQWVCWEGGTVAHTQRAAAACTHRTLDRRGP
jgi:hypothetical protein